jgi:hypothetical protein
VVSSKLSYVQNLNFYKFIALLTLCFVLLHTCWSIIMFSACSSQNLKSFRLWIGIFLVVASHFLASGIVSFIFKSYID